MSKTPAPGQVRIIAGQWRGRKLPVLALPGLRPTPDRLRETLFNWLMPMLPGAHCLDLFAGSGALGLEAASRGAASVLLIEQQAQSVTQLRNNIRTLNAPQLTVQQADALAFLQGPAQPFDLVFVDPPFQQNLLAPVCEALEQRHWLRPTAWIYLEMEKNLAMSWPSTWTLLREQHSREIRSCLLRRDATL